MSASAEAAVARTETYVAAVEALGHRGPGLTAGGVRDWYDAERGLRPAALEADGAALAAAAAGAEDALVSGRAAAAVLREAWIGESASAAAEFVERQCASAAVVAAGLADAAMALSALRDRLAGLLEAKADAAVRIDDRRAGERAGWLAAARAVLDGSAGTEAVAVVERRVAPYVAGDICGDWVTAMRAGTAAVAAAYDEAVARIGERPRPRFEHPPPPPPPPSPPAARSFPVPPAARVSAVPPGPESGGSAASWPIPSPPDPGGGLAGLVSDIAGLLGGYSGPVDPLGAVDPIDPFDPIDPAGAAGVSDTAEDPDPRDDDPRDEDPGDEDPGDEDPGDEDPGDEDPDDARGDDAGEAGPGTAQSQTVPAQDRAGPAEPPAPLAAEASEPAPEPDPEPAPQPLTALPADQPADRTPCEIAADELPQVGR